MKKLEKPKIKKKYEEPIFEEEKGEYFTEEIYNSFAGSDTWCFGCSNCNCGSHTE